MTTLTLDAANAIINAAFEKGRQLSLQPLCVAVIDAGSHVIAVQRQDGASTLRPQIAHAKAAGALSMGMSSRRIGDLAAERPAFVNALAPLTTFGIVPAAGGVIIVDVHGVTLGAVGVTGDISDNDEACALAGIAAAHFAARGE